MMGRLLVEDEFPNVATSKAVLRVAYLEGTSAATSYPTVRVSKKDWRKYLRSLGVYRWEPWREEPRNPRRERSTFLDRRARSCAVPRVGPARLPGYRRPR